MLYDSALLRGVEEGTVPPTLRFFRFKEPTVSFGRLQKWKDIAPHIPQGWPSVQRPTGGGIVYHNQDQCFSLIWPERHLPIPAKLKEVYLWIHTVVQNALEPWLKLDLATCADCRSPELPYAQRQCFESPTMFDLLQENKKIVGGAIARKKIGFLYQGTICCDLKRQPLEALKDAFRRKLQGLPR